MAYVFELLDSCEMPLDHHASAADGVTLRCRRKSHIGVWAFRECVLGRPERLKFETSSEDV
jgi:hypothetical protein